MELLIRGRLRRSRAWKELWADLAAIAHLSGRQIASLAKTARAGIFDNFRREQSPAGVPWHPLAPMTQRERESGIDSRGIPFNVGAEHPILRRTDDLRDSFTDPTHPRNVTDITTDESLTVIELGAVDDPKTPGRIANLHAGGRTDEGREIPARPFIGLSGAAMRQLQRQTEGIFMKRLEALED